MNRNFAIFAAFLAVCTFAGEASAKGYARSSAAPVAMAPDGLARSSSAVTGLALPPPAITNLVSNGSFETNGGVATNSFTGWTVVNQGGSSGNWFVQTGGGSPQNGFGVNPPTDGSFAAMTDTTGPGSHVLYQDVTIPAGGATLEFDLLLSNQAGGYISPPSLDVNCCANQQFRVDLMDTAAGDFDVGMGVLSNIYQTTPASPLSFGYGRISTVIAGTGMARTVRLRFAEVDNQFFFNVGIDNVTLVAPSADLAIAVTAANTTRRVGQAAIFAVGIINDGPGGSGATSVTLTLDAALAGMAVSAPAGWTCTTPALAANSTSSTCTTADVAANSSPLFNVSVPLTDPLGGQMLSLIAAVAGTTPDPNLGDNTDSATIQVTAEANLRLTFFGPTGPVPVGTRVAVSARLDNYGANAAHYPVVTLNVNAPASAVSLATPAGWSCNSGVDKTIQSIMLTASFQCSYLAGLYPRGTVLFPLAITPPASLAGTMVMFDGSAYSQTTDPFLGNNVGSFKLTVRPLAGFSPVVPPTH